MVSCVVTTYKRPISILKRAIDSIINQTYKDIELIVVNDAPEDAVLAKKIDDMLKQYTVSKKYIVHEKNQGACVARNTGIENAQGDFLAFLDDDDEWLSDKLEIQMTFMQKYDVALVYCSHYIIDSVGRKRLIVEPLAREGVYKDDFEKLLCCNFIGSTSYPLLKTEAVRAVGGFTKGLKASQDHDLWLRIARQYNIVYCNKPLVILYYSDESISRNMNNCMQGYEYLLNKYDAIYKDNTELLSYRLNYLAYCFVCYGEKEIAWKYWKRAIRVKPLSKNNVMLLTRAIDKLKSCFKSKGNILVRGRREC